jgi:hypothetical protein
LWLSSQQWLGSRMRGSKAGLIERLAAYVVELCTLSLSLYCSLSCRACAQRGKWLP